MDDFPVKPPPSVARLSLAIERVVPARRPPTEPRSGLLDAAVLLEVCGDDPVVLEAICRALAEQTPRHLTAIEVALAAGNALQLRDAAHKLAGMVSTFSTLVGDLVCVLEERAASGELAEARLLIDQLPSLMRDLLSEAAGISLEALHSADGKTNDQPTGAVR
jgi:hypothetical protein